MQCVCIHILILHIIHFYRVSPSHRPKSRNGNANNSGLGENVSRVKYHHRSFPLTQLIPRADTIPPPQKFRNNERQNMMIINGLPYDPIHTATQTTLVSYKTSKRLIK